MLSPMIVDILNYIGCKCDTSVLTLSHTQSSEEKGVALSRCIFLMVTWSSDNEQELTRQEQNLKTVSSFAQFLSEPA